MAFDPTLYGALLQQTPPGFARPLGLQQASAGIQYSPPGSAGAQALAPTTAQQLGQALQTMGNDPQGQSGWGQLGAGAARGINAALGYPSQPPNASPQAAADSGWGQLGSAAAKGINAWMNSRATQSPQASGASNPFALGSNPTQGLGSIFQGGQSGKQVGGALGKQGGAAAGQAIGTAYGGPVGGAIGKFVGGQAGQFLGGQAGQQGGVGGFLTKLFDLF